MIKSSVSCSMAVFALALSISGMLHQESAAQRFARGASANAVKTVRNVEYARPDGRPLRLDLYIPANVKSPRPLVVWIHGGGWQSGSKEDTPAVMLTDRGYVVASIQYRLSSEAIFPAQIHDCKAALRWLRAHAAEYGIDPARVGVWGPSAGGHLSALLGTSGGVKELEGGPWEQSSRVQAVCDFCGPTDFLQMDANALPRSPFRHNAPESPESKLIGGHIVKNRDKVARANPITYVSRDDPPFFIVHGDQDTIVPLHQSRLLHEALEGAGVEVELEVIRGGGHFFGGRDTMRRVGDFFDRHLTAKTTKKK